MSTVGSNIKALRERHGISQQALAEIAGVSRSSVAKWEGGETSFIRPANLANIIEHFGVSEDDLLSDAMGIAAQQDEAADGPAERKRAAYLPFVPFYDTSEEYLFTLTEQQRSAPPRSKLRFRYPSRFRTPTRSPR